MLSVLILSMPFLAGLPPGWDAIAYTAAARALVSGGDPWHVAALGITYAGPPPGLLPYLPFVWLSDVLVAASWVLIAAGSAVYTVRRLGLPWWWLLFPPITLGVAAGSTVMPMVALLVRGGVVSQGLAVLVRLQAAVPLVILGRWRPLVIAAVGLLVTAPFLAWPAFVAERGHIANVLHAQAGGLSAWSVPWTIPIALVALALLGRERAAWLLVPALWPDTQLYYAVLALPVIAGMPIVAAATALPIPGLIVAGLAAQAVWERFAGGHRRAAMDARRA